MSDADLRGSLIAEKKRCGKPNCRCARGELHGPYYYRRWRDASGRQRKEYVPREQAKRVRATLERARGSNVWARLRELRKLLDGLDGDAKVAQRRMAEQLGRHWHGRRLRERRSFPAEQRDRALYRLNPEGVQAACGWEITENDFVKLQRMIRSERKRRNRLGLPWRAKDPVTGAEVLLLSLDLTGFLSYQKHVQRQQASQIGDDDHELATREKEEGDHTSAEGVGAAGCSRWEDSN